LGKEQGNRTDANHAEVKADLDELTLELARGQNYSRKERRCLL